jgi:hypothetical protein
MDNEQHQDETNVAKILYLMHNQKIQTLWLKYTCFVHHENT